MKTILVAALLLFSAAAAWSQEVNVLLKQAQNYERAVKEDSALLKYKEVLALSSDNIQALIKISLLTTANGARQVDKPRQKELIESGKGYAEKALAIDSNNTDALFAKGYADLKLMPLEQENKKMVAIAKEARSCAEKVLAINPAHGRANFLMGKWNFDIVNVAWTKKATVKVLYGGIPEATIEQGIDYMEKCRIAEPYFVQNFLELGKAYKFNNNPQKAIEVFKQLVKLPTRTADDVAWKAEGKKLLDEML